jgi:hypothetical protein
MRSPYQTDIAAIVAATGNIGIDPRHVEGWMRQERPTLDAISKASFRELAIESIECAKASDSHTNELMAEFCGL